VKPQQLDGGRPPRSFDKGWATIPPSGRSHDWIPSRQLGRSARRCCWPQPFYAVEVRKALTVNVDEHVLEALQRAAANDGVQEDELVHEALRRYLGLRGLAVLDDIARMQAERGVQLDEDEAMALAVTEVRAARAERRRARGA
jgi:hypothetical protein